MAKEIQLINQVEQYEYLYNFNLPEYNRKDLTDEAWGTIAANINMSIADCKEKWRNMRTTFLKSMKPSLKVKRPYYLSEHLKFVIPFLKPRSIGIKSRDDTQSDSQSNTVTNETEVTSTTAALSNTITNEAEVVLTSVSSVTVLDIKEEPTEGENEENNENHSDNGILSDPLARESTALRKRRRFLPKKKKQADSLRNRSKEAPSTLSTFQKNFSSRPDSTSADNKALRMFLMSLIPELEIMTEEQFRIFKIEAMMLIDEIKVN